MALPLLVPGQAQKEVTHNEALIMMDALVHMAIEGAGLGEPPSVVLPGQAWLVASPAAGPWAGHEGRIACWTSAGWRFLEPVEGMAFWDKEGGRRIRLHDGNWAIDWPFPAPLAPVPLPAGGDVIDSEVRAAVSQLIDRLRLAGLLGA
jgi:hypothetical protein